MKPSHLIVFAPLTLAFLSSTAAESNLNDNALNDRNEKRSRNSGREGTSNISTNSNNRYGSRGRIRPFGKLSFSDDKSASIDCANSINIQLFIDDSTKDQTNKTSTNENDDDDPTVIKFNPSKKACKSNLAFVGSSSDGHRHVTLLPSRSKSLESSTTSFTASVTDDVTGAVYSIGPDATGAMMVTERYQEDYGEELDPKEEEEDEEEEELVEEKERGSSRLLEGRITRYSSSRAKGYNEELRENVVSTAGLRGKAAHQFKHLGDRFLSEENEGSSRNLQSQNPIIDVLVLWTSHAECRQSNLPRGCTRTAQTESNIRALIDLAVLETNVAYELSGVNAELKLVHAYRTGYVEVNSNAFETALGKLKRKNDGVLEDAHQKREEYHADVVALIIDDNDYCGIAYMGPSKDNMFSVTSYSCATGYYSFGHEIGHNLGCNHDRGTSNACTSDSDNYGYRDPDAGFRSILAYNCKGGQCDNNAGGGCSRVQRFSNPDIQFNGKAIGSNQHNNARRINDVAETVEAYYQTLPTGRRCPTPPACTDTMLELTVVADQYVSENSWTLTDGCTLAQVMWSDIDVDLANSETYCYQKCVPQGMYTFTINDSYGDGICCGYGNGSYSMSYMGESREGGDFDNTASLTMGSCTPDTSEPTKSPTSSPTKNPTLSPSTSPTVAPTKGPTNSPTGAPTRNPTSNPTKDPTTAPTDSPTNPNPTKSPTVSPTSSPSVSLTLKPTALPTVSPTTKPSTSPTPAPSTSPSVPPTPEPSNSPTLSPTPKPTTSPTLAPSTSPSNSPTPKPTSSPTSGPSTSPKISPTPKPTTSPTVSPTPQPTTPPTLSPSTSPSTSPTPKPTTSPTVSPTKAPTASPSPKPSTSPTASPTPEPSISPTVSPTKAPTVSPTLAPTTSPSVSPTPEPTSSPTVSPTQKPSASPTPAPTKSPSVSPTPKPTSSPTVSPTHKPSASPTPEPTTSPTVSPTKKPSNSPTAAPTTSPSVSPTPEPTTEPSTSPSQNPTVSTGPVIATFDANLGTPRCFSIGSSCTSGEELLHGKQTGRFGSNIELNLSHNNLKLSLCEDGQYGGYHEDESVDKITVVSVMGGQLKVGGLAEIQAKVWAWRTGATDTADFYYAADASSNLEWIWIGSVVPSGGGVQTLKAQYNLPTGSRQAVRVNFRYSGSQSSCSDGYWDDVDDLVFEVAAATGADEGVNNDALSLTPIPLAPVEPLSANICRTLDDQDRCVAASPCSWRGKRGCRPSKKGKN